MNDKIKYKCISVASVTYAQKGADILRRKGINAYVIKQTEKNEFGCARCIKIREKNFEKAFELLKQGGVRMSGDVYDL